MPTGTAFRRSSAALSRTPRNVLLVVATATTTTLLLELVLWSGGVVAAAAGYTLAYVAYTVGCLRLYRAVPILQAFALLSAFRLVNLSVPAFVDLTVYWLPLVYVAFVPAAAVALRARRAAVTDSPSEADALVDPLSWNTPATRKLLAETVAGPSRRRLVLSAPVLIGAGALVAVLQGTLEPSIALVPELTPSTVALLTVVVTLAAVVEELLFRGLLQSAIAEWLEEPTALLLAALLFAAMQQATTAPSAGLALVAGVLYGGAYAYTRSLFAPALAHVVANVVLLVGFHPGSAWATTPL